RSLDGQAILLVAGLDGDRRLRPREGRHRGHGQRARRRQQAPDPTTPSPTSRSVLMNIESTHPRAPPYTAPRALGSPCAAPLAESTGRLRGKLRAPVRRCPNPSGGFGRGGRGGPLSVRWSGGARGRLGTMRRRTL